MSLTLPASTSTINLLQALVALNTEPMMAGKVVFLGYISRTNLKAEPEARFVFGDNLLRVGMGGQAGSMRGEPNAIGVATKRAPGMRDDDFFSDESPADLAAIDEDIDRVVAAHLEGRTIYLPRDGIGTGLSELPTRAPKIHQHIINRFRALVADDAAYPWGN